MADERRTVWWISGILTAVLVAGAGIYLYQQRKATVAIAEKPVAPPAPVEISISISGSVRARNLVMVAAPVEGILESADVLVGQEVFTGQFLGRIQNLELDQKKEIAGSELDRIQNRLNNLESQLISERLEASRADAEASSVKSRFGQAEKNFQRQEMLLREGATPRLTYEKAESEYKALRIENDALTAMSRQASGKVQITMQNLEEARRQLAEKNEDLDDVDQQVLSTEIHSPVDGILIAQRAASGDPVTFEMKDLFQVAVNPSELQAVIEVNEEQAARIQVGQPAQVLLTEAGGQPLEGLVSAVQPQQVVIDFSAPLPILRPGLTVQVHIDF